MKWKFWQKSDADPAGRVLPRPKDLPESVGRHLVVERKMDPDWVWSLKAALRPREESPDVKDIRIFSPATADEAGVAVRHFAALDPHPELILYEGWFDAKTHKMELLDKSTERAA